MVKAKTEKKEKLTDTHTYTPRTYARLKIPNNL